MSLSLSSRSVPLGRLLVLICVVLSACEERSTRTPQPSPTAAGQTGTPSAGPSSAPPTVIRPTELLEPLLTPTRLPIRTPNPATSTPYPSPTPFPPDAIAAFSVWKPVDSGTEYRLLQISETPLGVVSLDWSPDAQNLWISLAEQPSGMGGLVLTSSLATNRFTRRGWAAGQRGAYLGCSEAHDWSPDGSRLAYVDRGGQLWISDPEGLNPVAIPLPTGTSQVGLPSYSPDGSLIAVEGSHIQGGAVLRDLWIVDASTGTSRLIIPNVGSGRFAWSPAGGALAHLGEASSPSYPIGAARLWIAEITSGKLLYTDLSSLPGTEGCLSPTAWVLGGERVLATVLLTPVIWLVDREGNVERLDEQPQSQLASRGRGLAAPLLGGPTGCAGASPDGRYVVYTTRNGTGPYALDLQTGRQVSVTIGDSCPTAPETWSPVAPEFLRWGETLSLAVVSAVDGSVRELAPAGLWPVWSPDGRSIAYWQPEADGYALWLLTLDGAEPARLTSPSLDRAQPRPDEASFVYDLTPRWSSDGQAIAFVSLREKRPEAYLIELP